MNRQPEAQECIAVSVIIPVYNAAKYLRQCLDSICQQSLNNIEIICVDDGSKDDSYKILQEYTKKDSRFLVMKQRQAGAGAARNKGLEIAKGKYLSFLDADDYFQKDFLKTMYRKGENVQADIVICSAMEFNQQTKTINEMPQSLQKKWLPQKEVFSYKDMPDYIFNSFQNWAWNKLFRRDFIQKNSICFQELRRTNDLLFTCTALVLAERITTVQESFIFYRVNHGGNCQATNVEKPLDFFQAFCALKDCLEQLDMYESVRKSYLNWALEGCIHNVLSVEKSPVEKAVLQFLRRQGLQQMGLAAMRYYECYEKGAYMKLQCIKYNLWAILKLCRNLHLKVRQRVLLRRYERI